MCVSIQTADRDNVFIIMGTRNHLGQPVIKCIPLHRAIDGQKEIGLLEEILVAWGSFGKGNGTRMVDFWWGFCGKWIGLGMGYRVPFH